VSGAGPAGRPPALPFLHHTTDMAVSVRLGTAEFGLPIAQVREVLRTPRITAIPFAPAYVAGVVSVRGVLIPVVDLGIRLLGQAAVAPGRLVVVAGGAESGPVGLLVDAITGLVDAAPDLVLPPPAEAEAALPAGFVTGVLAPEAGQLVTLLHLPPVLSRAGTPNKEHP
jgi:purine-binding chemotaxis protein CheW